jgi:hypothetical protein
MNIAAAAFRDVDVAAAVVDVDVAPSVGAEKEDICCSLLVCEMLVIVWNRKEFSIEAESVCCADTVAGIVVAGIVADHDDSGSGSDFALPVDVAVAADVVADSAAASRWPGSEISWTCL